MTGTDTPADSTGSAAVDAYIADFPDLARALLTELRELSRAAVPEATETLKWNAPAYVHPRGTILFQLSGHKAHANMVFTPSVREAFEDEGVTWM